MQKQFLHIKGMNANEYGLLGRAKSYFAEQFMQLDIFVGAYIPNNNQEPIQIPFPSFVGSRYHSGLDVDQELGQVLR